MMNGDVEPGSTLHIITEPVQESRDPNSHRDRKTVHNSAEKKRKEKIRQCINRINEILPRPPADQPQNRSTLEIVEKAFEYIKELQEINNKCLQNHGDELQAQEINRLSRELESMRQERDQLKEQIRLAGVASVVTFKEGHDPSSNSGTLDADKTKTKSRKRNTISQQLENLRRQQASGADNSAETHDLSAELAGAGLLQLAMQDAGITPSSASAHNSSNSVTDDNSGINTTAVLSSNVACHSSDVSMDTNAMTGSSIGNNSVSGQAQLSGLSLVSQSGSAATATTQAINSNTPIMATGQNNMNSVMAVGNGLLNVPFGGNNQNLMTGGAPGFMTSVPSQSQQIMFINEQGVPCIANVPMTMDPNNLGLQNKGQAQGQVTLTSDPNNMMNGMGIPNPQGFQTIGPAGTVISNQMPMNQQMLLGNPGPGQGIIVPCSQNSSLINMNPSQGGSQQNQLPHALILPNGQIIPVVANPQLQQGVAQVSTMSSGITQGPGLMQTTGPWQGQNMMATSQSNVVQQSAANMMQAGANVMPQGGNNLVQTGTNMLSQGGANVMQQGGANVMQQGGANLMQQGGPNVKMNVGVNGRMMNQSNDSFSQQIGGIGQTSDIFQQSVGMTTPASSGSLLMASSPAPVSSAPALNTSGQQTADSSLSDGSQGQGQMAGDGTTTGEQDSQTKGQSDSGGQQGLIGQGQVTYANQSGIGSMPGQLQGSQGQTQGQKCFQMTNQGQMMMPGFMDASGFQIPSSISVSTAVGMPMTQMPAAPSSLGSNPILLNMKVGGQQTSVLVDPNTMQVLGTLQPNQNVAPASTSAPVTQQTTGSTSVPTNMSPGASKKSNKKGSQRQIVPKPQKGKNTGDQVWTDVEENHDQSAPNAQSSKKAKTKSKQKQNKSSNSAGGGDQLVTSSTDADTTDILAKAAESIFSSEISPPIGFYNPANEDNPLQIDTTVGEENDSAGSPSKMTKSSEEGRRPNTTGGVQVLGGPGSTESMVSGVDRDNLLMMSSSQENSTTSTTGSFPKHGSDPIPSETKKSNKRARKQTELDKTNKMTEDEIANTVKEIIDNVKSATPVALPPKKAIKKTKKQQQQQQEAAAAVATTTKTGLSEDDSLVQLPESLTFSENDLNAVLDQVEGFGHSYGEAMTPSSSVPPKKNKNKLSSSVEEKTGEDGEPANKKRKKTYGKEKVNEKGKDKAPDGSTSMSIYDFSEEGGEELSPLRVMSRPVSQHQGSTAQGSRLLTPLSSAGISPSELDKAGGDKKTDSQYTSKAKKEKGKKSKKSKKDAVPDSGDDLLSAIGDSQEMRQQQTSKKTTKKNQSVVKDKCSSDLCASYNNDSAISSEEEPSITILTESDGPEATPNSQGSPLFSSMLIDSISKSTSTVLGRQERDTVASDNNTFGAKSVDESTNGSRDASSFDKTLRLLDLPGSTSSASMPSSFGASGQLSGSSSNLDMGNIQEDMASHRQNASRLSLHRGRESGGLKQSKMESDKSVISGANPSLALGDSPSVDTDIDTAMNSFLGLTAGALSPSLVSPAPTISNTSVNSSSHLTRGPLHSPHLQTPKSTSPAALASPVNQNLSPSGPPMATGDLSLGNSMTNFSTGADINYSAESLFNSTSGKPGMENNVNSASSNNAANNSSANMTNRAGVIASNKSSSASEQVGGKTRHSIYSAENFVQNSKGDGNNSLGNVSNSSQSHNPASGKGSQPLLNTSISTSVNRDVGTNQGNNTGTEAFSFGPMSLNLSSASSTNSFMNPMSVVAPSTMASNAPQPVSSTLSSSSTSSSSSSSFTFTLSSVSTTLSTSSSNVSQPHRGGGGSSYPFYPISSAQSLQQQQQQQQPPANPQHLPPHQVPRPSSSASSGSMQMAPSPQHQPRPGPNTSGADSAALGIPSFEMDGVSSGHMQQGSQKRGSDRGPPPHLTGGQDSLFYGTEQPPLIPDIRNESPSMMTKSQPEHVHNAHKRVQELTQAASAREENSKSSRSRGGNMMPMDRSPHFSMNSMQHSFFPPPNFSAGAGNSQGMNTHPLHHPPISLSDDRGMNSGRSYDAVFSPQSQPFAGPGANFHGNRYDNSAMTLPGHHREAGSQPLSHTPPGQNEGRKSTSSQSSGPKSNKPGTPHQTVSHQGSSRAMGGPSPSGHNGPAPPHQQMSHRSTTPQGPPSAPPSRQQKSSRSSKQSQKKSKQQAMYGELDSPFAHGMFDPNRSLTPFFLPPPQASLSPPARNMQNEPAGLFAPNLFGPGSRHNAGSGGPKNADIGPPFNPLFGAGRTQNGLGLNFQAGFGMNSVHGAMSNAPSIASHSASVTVTPHMPNFSLPNIFSDVNNSSQSDSLNISPIKFPHSGPMLQAQGIDHNALQHPHQGPSIYHHHNRSHPPVLHNMSINNILGHNHHGFDGRQMTPSMNTSVAPPFPGAGHPTSFGMPPLNFSMHE